MFNVMGPRTQKDTGLVPVNITAPYVINQRHSNIRIITLSLSLKLHTIVWVSSIRGISHVSLILICHFRKQLHIFLVGHRSRGTARNVQMPALVMVTHQLQIASSHFVLQTTVRVPLLAISCKVMIKGGCQSECTWQFQLRSSKLHRIGHDTGFQSQLSTVSNRPQSLV